jgi:hypothetical protein
VVPPPLLHLLVCISAARLMTKIQKNEKEKEKNFRMKQTNTCAHPHLVAACLSLARCSRPLRAAATSADRASSKPAGFRDMSTA